MKKLPWRHKISDVVYFGVMIFSATVIIFQTFVEFG